MSSGQDTKGAEGGDNSNDKKEEGSSNSQGAAGGDNPDSKEGGENKNTEQKEEEKKSALFDAFAVSLGLKDEPKIESLLDTVDFNGIVKYIKDGKAKNIITMAGAGISTSAGIPDFRSPETGLYDNLQKYNLPEPTAVFSIDYFKENPEPFFMLARELWPGVFKPTTCHYFIRMLQEKGLLLRHFTQNIDTLESVAGLDPEVCVEAHGHFRTGHCIQCRAEYTQDWMKERIMKPSIPKCEAEGCEGVVKPDIVFFGESLPHRFLQCMSEDFGKCDLLIIMGTSLLVQPFASLVNRTKENVPRMYINLENSCPPRKDKTGPYSKANNRDIFWQGTCDDGCMALAEALGWGEELKNLVTTEHAKIDAANPDKGTTSTKTADSTPEKTEATPKKADTTPKKTENTPKKCETPKTSDKTPPKPEAATPKATPGSGSKKTPPKK
ncbi:NAD-dependent protein deacetylase sirtuin-2-like isoform X2 [Mytilus edulis]|uniref:NAD-dependent protein deacetylase sirtuin-2-like isoform X2 n=1 Tax=Mytilus edulis TaxID=6550 RepID=UPI0039EEECFE